VRRGGRVLHGCVVALLALGIALMGVVGTTGAAAPGTVVASGFSSPRNLAVAPDGTIYVSEGGTGGTEKTPSAPDRPDAAGTRGYTGQVSKVTPGGTKSVVAKGLASYGGGEVIGPSGIVYANGFIWLAIGGMAVEAKLTPLTHENTVVKIDPATGAVTKVADIGAYEIANNPDGYGINANLYGMTLGADGNLYVADAGGNAVYQVNPATGALRVAAVIPGVAVVGSDFPPGAFPPNVPFSNPGRGGKAEVDPVPTDIAPGADGSLYVTLLPGALLPKKSKVVQITAAGVISDIAGGLTTLVGAAAGPDGSLYVASLTAGFAADGRPAPGSVMRILPGGRAEVVAEGLPAPNGIDFDQAGNLYIATYTINPGPQPQGQVVRFDGVAAVTAAPVPAPSPIASPPSPPPTGSGRVLPGLPNTGAGGTQPGLPLPGLFLTLALGGALLALRRRAA